MTNGHLSRATVSGSAAKSTKNCDSGPGPAEPGGRYTAMWTSNDLLVETRTTIQLVMLIWTS